MSAGGKLRLLAEPFIPPKQDQADESLAEFASRRLGKQAMEKFIGPILAGIYNTDPHTQSVLTTSPIMRSMEAEYGSLFKAAFKRMMMARNQNGGPKRPRFVAFANGAQDLISALVEQLAGDLRLGAQVSQVRRNQFDYELLLEGGETLQADALILATPANVAAQLLRPIDSEVANHLSEFRHTNIGTLSLVYRVDEVQLPQRIHGLMVPRREGRAIDAITFTSLKMPSRAPQEYLLVRVFFGGGAPELVTLSTDEFLSTVRRELADLLGIIAEPIEFVPFRWQDSFPQADVGHLDRVATIEAKLPTGIVLAGSSYRGIGVPDCIRQGRSAARQVSEMVKSNS
jgi:oxygen-dependent protoporphyrinogen oxidase